MAMSFVKVILLAGLCVLVTDARFSGFKWQGIASSDHKRFDKPRMKRQVSQQCLDALVAFNSDTNQECLRIYGVFQGQFETPSQQNASDFCKSNCGELLLKGNQAIVQYCGDPDDPGPGIPESEEIFYVDSCHNDPKNHLCISDVLDLIQSPPSSAQSCFQAFESNQQCNSDCTQLFSYFVDNLGCCTELFQFALSSEVAGELKTIYGVCNESVPKGCGSSK
jgi:hypothetical protein